MVLVEVRFIYWWNVIPVRVSHYPVWKILSFNFFNPVRASENDYVNNVNNVNNVNKKMRKPKETAK